MHIMHAHTERIHVIELGRLFQFRETNFLSIFYCDTPHCDVVDIEFMLAI
jgi:hypothetical protein